MPDVWLPNDRATLLAYPFLRPPWTVLIATRFVRARRSLFYSAATTTDAELHSTLRRIRAMMQSSSRHAAWSGVKSPPGSLNVARTLADWRLWVWLILALPSIVYFVITDFPGTAGLQTSMETSRLWKPILIALLAGAMLWLLWQVTNLMRQQVDPAAGEARARVRLGLLAGLGGLFVGGYSLLQIFLGTRLDRPPVSTLHVLEALRAALLIVTVLAVVALILTFPPAGLPALAGIGSVGGGAAITISTEMVLGTVIVGGLSTALLMQASGDGGGSSGPTGPEREGIRLDRSGKVHTPPGQRLPNHVPSHWTRAELRELADDLRTSIANRKAEALRLGEEGGHRARIADEEQLLRQIENVLSGS